MRHSSRVSKPNWEKLEGGWDRVSKTTLVSRVMMFEDLL